MFLYQYVVQPIRRLSSYFCLHLFPDFFFLLLQLLHEVVLDGCLDCTGFIFKLLSGLLFKLTEGSMLVSFGLFLD